ncbi:MAG: DUF4013 domain-containing protein [Raoultibacter sp.]|jgi:hypothetical protein
MQISYYSAAWNDIKNSPGWVGKMFLLALISLIPIFGQIVVFGYLYGWARDIAWRIQGPMPKHIFGNEDGKLYSRGFFILVLGLVFGIVLGILSLIMLFAFGGGIAAAALGDSSSIGAVGVFLLVGGILAILVGILGLASVFFLWVGYMRISIYGRLSAGFQLKKIWKMLRKDFFGIVKIFGMVLLLSIIIGIIIQVVSTLVTLVFGVSLASFYSIFYGSATVSSTIADLATSGIVLFLFFVVYYLEMVVMMWVSTMSIRALGYWTQQFDVPNWRGQDDPMPFEVSQAYPAPQAGAQYYQQTPQGAHSYTQAPQGAQVPPTQAYPGQTYPQPQAPQQAPPVQVAPAQTPPVQTPSSEGVHQPPIEQAAATDSPSHTNEGADTQAEIPQAADEARPSEESQAPSDVSQTEEPQSPGENKS